MSIIQVKDLTKEFKIYKRERGFVNSVKSFFHREYAIKRAVDSIDFSIEKGEIVGYIGANGAGKSTTIKMLSGILVPTSGEVLVNGIIPHKNRREYSKNIGVVFGQRSQLHWDLPASDSYDLYKRMYGISDDRFRKNIEFFTELLDLSDFIDKPVRQLSLGQKMRAELAAALLHDPDILYLDEPTIGLDIFAKSKMREFIRQINAEKQTTVILTTHDMDDIEQTCQRLVMIDKGHIIYDGELDDFKNTYGGDNVLIVEFADKNVQLEDGRLKVIKVEGSTRHILFNKSEVSAGEAITYITRNFNIKDLNLKEPEIEDTIKKLYSREVDSAMIG